VSNSYLIVQGKKSALERCYLISSAELDLDRFAAACRGHWSIENNLHWVLDVSFDEDSCTIYSEKAAVSLAAIRIIG
jgi:predicted transposase YbfD/YdcC